MAQGKAKAPGKVCRAQTSVSKIKVEENGRSAVVRNEPRETYVVSQIDGCLIINKVACDWAISKVDAGDLFIELKGSDVDHAAEQILASMTFWRANQLGNGQFGGLVVCTRYPRVDTKIQKLMDRVAARFKAPLHVVTKNQEYEFARVLSFKGPL